MSAIYMFSVIILAVIAMVLAISKLKIHPFIVLTTISIVVGLLCGMDANTVINTVKNGFGSILGAIGKILQ